jgi:hypothetical protein
MGTVPCLASCRVRAPHDAASPPGAGRPAGQSESAESAVLTAESERELPRPGVMNAPATDSTGEAQAQPGAVDCRYYQTKRTGATRQWTRNS